MDNMHLPLRVRIFRLIPNTRYAILSLLCSLFFLQCKKDLTTTSSSAKLSFSTNLIFFDTVFATGVTGSSVRIFLVHNYNKEAVNISSIRLAGSSSSFYKINVDGVAGSSFNNIKIPANDSIYVFAQVNVNPLNANNPLVIEDSLQFITNGNVQYVRLQAFGWDAYYYYPNILPPYGPAYSVLPCGTVWKNDKPHVILGYLVVPPGCTLNVGPGAGVYLDDSAVLYIDSGATLNVTGSAFQPVTFQGDRLEPAYKNIPGQWGEILLTPGSINNNISWAIIQNGTTGIQADTVYNSNPTLTMDHTIIKSMSSYGVWGLGAIIEANNCLIADCQSNCVFLYIGGKYTFNLCTFADYWGVDNSNGQRTTPLLYMNNNYQSYTGQKIPRNLNALFDNCIIYGALNEEVYLDSNYGAQFNYYFENCLIKTQHATPTGVHYNTVYVNQDPSFSNPYIDGYLVNPGSPALGKADIGITSPYGLSLDNQKRPTTGATIGAYEQ